MNQINLKNRTIFCKDNLEVLKGINSNSIDLIYLDPPFNKNKTFSAPIGSSAEGASFTDIFREEDVKDEWIQEIKEDYDGLYKFLNNIKELSSITNITKNKHYLYNYCYLCYMAIRLIEMRRILKDTGSIYLHCDPTMSHYLKILLDIVFGEQNFRNEIIWWYSTGGVSKNRFSKKHDVIFYYVKNDKEFLFNSLQEKSYTKSKSRKAGVINYGGGEAEFFQDDKGVYNIVNMKDTWNISYIGSTHSERTGYPTQKPLALLERIIQASSNEGDIVLDPFCGCATTCIASEKLNRKWIGIDVSVKAYELVKERLKKEVANPNDLLQYDKEVVFSTEPPKRTDRNGEDNLIKKYVYVASNSAFKGYYKVGITSNTDRRIENYQTSDPNRGYKLEHRKFTHLFRETEKFIHEKYDSKHEWVKGNLQDIIDDVKNYE